MSSKRNKRDCFIQHWSEGFFCLDSSGQPCIYCEDGSRMPLQDLADRLQQADAPLPLIIRVRGILHTRLHQLQQAFAHAIQQQAYRSSYDPVYPVKTNPQHTVVRDLLHAPDSQLGLEVGSKAELLLAMAELPAGRALLCNGYKDTDYISLAIQAQQAGLNVTLIIDKPAELGRIVGLMPKHGPRPRLGIRARLRSIAYGHWQNTGGALAKFGLTAHQLLTALTQLKQHGLLPQLHLLHVHLGSQIANLNDIARGLQEAGRIYCELSRLGAPLDALDVGGGLAVDYTGQAEASASSRQYSLQDYADTVVRTVGGLCHETGTPPPRLITECGRALVAHHAFILMNVAEREPLPTADQTSPGTRSWSEAQARAETQTERFLHGQSSLLEQAATEQELHLSAGMQLKNTDAPLTKDKRELLHRMAAERLCCNFSLFQSLPDAWGLQQPFPILALQACGDDATPHQTVLLRDLTCDSDGRIDHYPAHDGVHQTLCCKLETGQPTPLFAVFLLGAYQESLGDIHNLFGRPACAHISLETAERLHLHELIPAHSMADVLQQAGYDANALRQQLATRMEPILSRNDTDTLLQRSTYLKYD